MPAPLRTLLILIDQFRADCVSGALGAHAHLPNLRRLQQQAVTFEQHYSVATPCGPSRASILTGLYAMTHRSVRNGTPLSDALTNLALELRKGGIEPLLYGYTDTSRDPRGRPAGDPLLASYEQVLPGFSEVVEMRLESGSTAWHDHLRAKGYRFSDRRELYSPVSPDPGRPPRPNDPALYQAPDSDTAFLTDRFLDDMSARSRQPWFALLAYIRPHPPFVAPAPYNRMHDPARLPRPLHRAGPQREDALHPFIAHQRTLIPLADTVHGCAGLSDDNPDDVQAVRAVYLGLASEVDHHVGRVISFLRESGQYDDTLLIVTSDHGEMLGDHHMWGKAQIYDAAFRIPLIVRDPRNPEQFGTRVSAFTESTDIAPTILERAALPVPPGMDGRALTPFLQGRRPDRWRDAVMMELDFAEPDAPTRTQRALGLGANEGGVAILRTGDFKLVHFAADLPPLLFDMRNDGAETKDLAGDPRHRDTLLRMTRKLLSHRMKHADHALTGMRITGRGVYGHTFET